jgi:predicted acyltransferase
LASTPPDQPPADRGQGAAPARVESVDVLRGFTIFLMVFVNDLGRAAPYWLHHIQPPDADGMTVADWVFPSFLFIVGVSIPLALERARLAGVPLTRRLAHIFIRTASLLLMGVIVNDAENETGRLGPELWEVLTSAAIVLAWCVVPRDGRSRRPFVALKVIGIVGLVALLALFRRKPESAEVMYFGRVENWVWLRSSWWGILGLVGWAYLTGSLLTLLLGRRREWLAGALGVLILLHLASRPGLFSHFEKKPWLEPAAPVLHFLSGLVNSIEQYVGLGDATGSLASITVAGCLLGSILCRGSDVVTPRERVAWAATFAFGLFAAGFVTDTFEGINKIGSTPTWCLWSAALACTLWIGLYLVVDVYRFSGWSLLLRATGANPLVAYFLHPIVVGVIAMLPLARSPLAYKDSHDPGTAVAGSLAMALLVCTLASLLGRLGLRVRL